MVTAAESICDAHNYSLILEKLRTSVYYVVDDDCDLYFGPEIGSVFSGDLGDSALFVLVGELLRDDPASETLSELGRDRLEPVSHLRMTGLAGRFWTSCNSFLTLTTPVSGSMVK